MWNLLSEIAISTQWAWTPPTDAEWFRFEFVQQQEVRVDIVAGDGLSLFEMPIRVTTSNPQILRLRRPPLGMSTQQIAVRTGDRVYRNYSLGWKVKVFVSDEIETPADLQVLQSQQTQILDLLEELMPLARSNQPAVTSSTGTSTIVPAAIASTVLLAANPDRKGVIFHSGSTAVLSVKLGADATATDRAFPLGLGDYYELPFGYTGIISGIWSAADGNLVVTELT